jgi:hypothetical protein
MSSPQDHRALTIYLLGLDAGRLIIAGDKAALKDNLRTARELGVQIADEAFKLTSPTCIRCNCTELAACHDSRLSSPCCWSHIENVCSACLTESEFEAFVQLHPEMS